MPSSFLLSLPFAFESVMLIVLGVLILLVAGVLALQVYNAGKVANLTSPVYDRVIKEAEQKANALVQEASEEARRIRAAAQEESVALLSGRKEEAEKRAVQFEQELKSVVEHEKELLERYTKSAEDAYKKLGDTLHLHIEGSDKAVAQEVNKLHAMLTKEREEIAARLATYDQEMKTEREKLAREASERIEKELAGELERARTEVEAFRKARKAMIDKKLVDLVEQVAGAVLHKKLSLDEHAGLVIEALEEVKKEGALKI